MYVHVTGKRTITQTCEFAFDAKDDSELKDVESLLNSDENVFKLADCVEWVDTSAETSPFKVFKIKKKPTEDDNVITQGDLCQMI